MSLGHGDFTGYLNGRYFQNFKTKAIKDFLASYAELELLEIWKSSENFGEANIDEWLHIIIKKQEEKQE